MCHGRITVDHVVNTNTGETRDAFTTTPALSGCYVQAIAIATAKASVTVTLAARY